MTVNANTNSSATPRAFDLTRSGPILIVRWNAPPRDAHFAELEREVAAARDLAAGPLVYVTVLPRASSELLSERVRTALAGHLDAVSVHCRSCEIVLERWSDAELAALSLPHAHTSVGRALSSAAPRSAARSSRPTRD